ncbi:hypothetical protein B9J78_06015 [bacterium Unc6]|nr:hypothetical protein [bacterium Unc6]
MTLLQLSEDRDDIASISGLVKKVSKVIQVGVSVSIFVPKPGTPFESENIISEKDAREKIQFLSSEIKKIKNVKISFESPRIAALQYKLLSFDN